MSSRKLVLFSTLVIAVAALGPAAAPAKDKTAPLYAKLKQRFTTAKSGTSTGWKLDGALKPFPAGEQVPPARGTTFVFPRGTRLDLRGVEQCDASDEQITSEGIAACPAGSQIQSGEGTLFLGLAGILDVKVNSFAAPDGLASVFTTESGTVLRVVRASIERNRVNLTLPKVELPSGYEAAFTSLSLEQPKGGTRKHPLMRTPKKCPKSGKWKFVYLPQYDEPYGVQRSTHSVRCRRKG
jgi:hypothetical protein